MSAVAAGALVMAPGTALGATRSVATTTWATQVETPPAPPDDITQTPVTPAPGATPAAPAEDPMAAPSSPAASASGLNSVTTTGAKAPSVFSPVDGSTVLQGAEVLASYDCADSPPPPIPAYSCLGTVPVGAPIDTASLGIHEFTVVFTHSFVGHLGTTTVTYEVVPPALPSIAGSVLEEGTADPLPGVFVAALRAADYSGAGGAVTDSFGEFSLTLPDGEYLLFLIDPTDSHRSGFWGSPSPVTVTDGSTADVDPTLAPTRGSITGSITETGSGNPIGSAGVLTLSSSGQPELGTTADGSGAYTIDDVTAGDHYLLALDPSGARDLQFLGGTKILANSTPVPVTGGTSTSASPSLPAQAQDPGGEPITGTVTDDSTDQPLPGVQVIALDAATFGFVRSTTTDAIGGYSLALSPGDYLLVFIDSTGGHHAEWHGDASITQLAAAVPVTAPGVVDAALAPANGAAAGVVTESGTNTPLSNVWVVAIDPSGVVRGGVATNGSGAYTISGLPEGPYRFAFVDPSGDHLLEYSDESPDYGGATPILVSGGATVSIDESLDTA